MKENSAEDAKLIARIKSGDSSAWNDLIINYEGRLLSFTDRRLGNRHASEEVVQETFIGFLSSLSNYDGKRSLESYLFSICAYKLTDHLRREGRRPVIAFDSGSESSSDDWQLRDKGARAASSLARSIERKDLEEVELAEALGKVIDEYLKNGKFVNVKCIELIIARGLRNKQVEKILNLSPQHISNIKSDFVSRLRASMRRKGVNEDVFPELYED